MKKPRWSTWEKLAEKPEPPPLSLDLRPQFFSTLNPLRDGAEVTGFDLGFEKFSFAAEPRHRALVRAIDGQRTVGELARAADLGVHDAQAFVQTLFEKGIVREAGEALVPALTFHAQVQSLIRRADFKRNSGGLFTELKTNPTAGLVMSYLLQTYHWTSSANLHASAGIHHAPTERAQMILVDFLGDEYWHGQWMKRGLLAGGLTETQVQQSVPLPAIAAHINLVTQAATHSTLAYAAILTGMEGVPAEKTGALETVWDSILKSNVVNPEAVMPFKHHSLSDEAYGHDKVGIELYAGFRPLDRLDQDTVYRWLFMYLNNRNEVNAAVLRAHQNRDEQPHWLSVV